MMALRTLNVVNEIPQVASSLQVHIAYHTAPGVTLQDARRLERSLEADIQAAIYRLGHQEPADAPFEEIRFIPIQQVLAMLAMPSKKAFANWRDRHNAAHPEAPVITRPELVELNSLKAALKATANGKNAA